MFSLSTPVGTSFIATAHAVPGDAPAENVITELEAVRDLRYPLERNP